MRWRATPPPAGPRRRSSAPVSARRPGPAEPAYWLPQRNCNAPTLRRSVVVVIAWDEQGELRSLIVAARDYLPERAGQRLSGTSARADFPDRRRHVIRDELDDHPARGLGAGGRRRQAAPRRGAQNTAAAAGPRPAEGPAEHAAVEL